MASQNQLPEQNSDQPVLRGSCLCGLSTYTLQAPPLHAIVCHCSSCRKWSGSVFAGNLLFPKEALAPSQASTPYIKEIVDAGSQSGKPLKRKFCSECGSSLYTLAEAYGMVSVARGTVDVEEGKELPEPEIEFWCCRREPWVEIEGTTKKFEKNS